MTKTKDKANRCKIWSRIHQAIFAALLAEAQAEQEPGLEGEHFSRPGLSHTADVATKAVIHEERLQVVLTSAKALTRKESRKWISRTLRNQRLQGEKQSQNEQDPAT